MSERNDGDGSMLKLEAGRHSALAFQAIPRTVIAMRLPRRQRHRIGIYPVAKGTERRGLICQLIMRQRFEVARESAGCRHVPCYTCFLCS